MPHYALHALDRSDVAERRAQLRQAHRAYIRTARANCRCVLGGPLEDDAGRMIGSLLVVEAADRATAQRFFDEDPYARARLYRSRRIDVWRWGLGRTPGDHLPLPEGDADR